MGNNFEIWGNLRNSVPTSINDFVEMNILLCLTCFSICAKMQGFIEECVNYFFLGGGGGADTLWVVKNFVEIALSQTISKINAFLHFTSKFKMAAKNDGKVIFGKIASMLYRYPAGQQFRRNRSISHRFGDIKDFSFSALRNIVPFS